MVLSAAVFAAGPLDPRGQIHVPIGIPNTVDTLKTFVEAEGNFSPGFATYGIYFWLYDPNTQQLIAPTAPGAESERGLGMRGALIPWTRWGGGDFSLTSAVCQVELPWQNKKVHVAAAQVEINNLAKKPREVQFFVALRPIGPAGGPVYSISIGDKKDTFLVDKHLALFPERAPTAIGVTVEDDIPNYAIRGEVPKEIGVGTTAGNCGGLMRYDLRLPAEGAYQLGFICPVLPGRRAVGHQWDGKSPWAQLDLATPNPKTGGELQPDPGPDFYRKLKAAELFAQAERYWDDIVGRASIDVPDARWNEAFGAIVGHVAMAMNEGAPDVAVINYNVFNRDGVYAANILQKSGNRELAEACIDYFLTHPFNGRVEPEADNPGQILWVIGEHWRITRDRQWLDRVAPSAEKIARMIRYYRTAPEPHWVWDTSLSFGEDLPEGQRKRLKPGACDGFHPEYTEAFDIAGLRAAAELARAYKMEEAERQWSSLADKFLKEYEQKFGERLEHEYGSFAVVWPCRLYPFRNSPAHSIFRQVGLQKPSGWRYFPLATAHQGLLTGSRDAAYKTLDAHFDHDQMQGWYVLDEGGKSGPGNWSKARTTWNPDVAMPHGWAIAELWLLMRDALVHEDGNKLVLFSGVDPAWFHNPRGMQLTGLPTYFGKLGLQYRMRDGANEIVFTGEAAPPEGFVFCLPKRAQVEAGGAQLALEADHRVTIPAGTKQVTIRFETVDEGAQQAIATEEDEHPDPKSGEDAPPTPPVAKEKRPQSTAVKDANTASSEKR
jgi:hypothetical protein